MIPSLPSSYTAAQLAAALRLSKQYVLKALADSPATGVTIVRGNEAPTWTREAFPQTLVNRFVAEAVKAGVASEEYIAGQLKIASLGIKPWQPRLALSEVSDECLASARKLRDALLPALQREPHSQSSPQAATDGNGETLAQRRVRLGLDDYQRVFGHSVTDRHWRRLIDRTVWRDGGEDDFTRLELYLPENPTRKAIARALLPPEKRFAELAAAIQAFTNPSAPTRTEIAALWSEIFQLYNDTAQTRRQQRAWRRELFNFLTRHAPWLASNRHALRVAFERKFDRWTANGRSAVALLDGREEKRGVPRAEPIPQTDLDLITWEAAANCGGRIAQAQRNLAGLGEQSDLSPATLDLFPTDAASKSYVPRRLLDSVKLDVRNIKPYFLGKKAIDDARAHVQRDYSKLVSMQCVGADDFTLPVYFYVPDGQGWFTLTRGQCLLMLDTRSWKVIAWSLQPDRNYNSLIIRTLMNRVCASWGIPGVWYFERGIWKNALLVKGQAPAGWQDALSEAEVEVGWEKLGVKFKHAIRARSKPVERVGGLLQDLMHGVRGYCGRDERRDCPEVTKRAMQDVQFRRVNHPGELFLSFDEWNEQRAALIDRYNTTSQDGDVLRGLSPDEAFEAHWPHSNPPARMDANCWHLVAHYSRPAQITANGISFRIGSRKFVYRNERTGQDRGKTVLIHFDPECPDFLCVTDANRKNPYLVERATGVDFLAESGDPVLERELSKAAAHSAYPRARYHVLKAKFAPTFRRNYVDVETAETAQEISRQRDEKVAEQKETNSQLTKARAAYGRLGMTPPSADRLRPEQPEAARRLAQILNADDIELANLQEGR